MANIMSPKIFLKILLVLSLLTITASTALISGATPRRLTCDKWPRVCQLEGRGGAGPTCCGKRCVDVKSDGLNCGKCGRKCKRSETCCGGLCVDTSKDDSHCGRCNNYCGKGSSCSYALCGYVD